VPEAQKAEPQTLELLTRLAKEQVDLEAEIASDLVLMEEKNAKLFKLQRVRIPELMGTLGISEFKLTDGSLISVKEDVKANITADHKPAAFAWLVEHNFDGIIKTNVAVAFGKGEMGKAKEAMAILEKAGFSGAMDQSVHPATLKSFVKERLEKGDNIPIDTFGIFEFKQAKIKLPKSKK